MPAYLNGEYKPLEDCRPSARDRGFLFGDAVYEVVAVYDNTPFAIDKHLARLENSLRHSGIPNPHTRDEWLAIFARLIEDEPAASFGLYLHVSRGVADRDLGTTDLQPSVFAMTMPPAKVAPRTTIKAMTIDDPRWGRCDIKTTSLMGNVLVRRAANEKGFDDAVMLRNGEVTEATAANVFVVCDGVLHTPPNSERLLPGITRDVILEIAAEQNIAAKEVAFGVDMLRAADEIWLTSSIREIIAVGELDGKVVGDGSQPWRERFAAKLFDRTHSPR